MKVEVSHLLAYSRDRVWDVLLDPEVLARVMPGVEKFEEVGPEKYAVAMKLGVPAVRGSYKGSVQIVDKKKPDSYRLRGEGKGTPGQLHPAPVRTAGRCESGVGAGVVLADRQRRVADHCGASITDRFPHGVGG
jgi:carbon monoxide dehydrogenase subunit G